MEGMVMAQASGTPFSSFWNGRRTLVTGHTGFKGSWLSLWLLELGADLTGISLPADALGLSHEPLFKSLQIEQTLGKRHTIGDICEFESLATVVAESKPEVVFHLAAQPLVRRSYADPLGTWATNVQGSLNLLEALKTLQHTCAVVMVTTDKVYLNQEWVHAYRETDPLGGYDPYSSSKAAAEIAIASWRKSFCGLSKNQTPHLGIASARAGNVIGGGDWSEDRIFPDIMRAVSNRTSVSVRYPEATRPWQHVIEPLAGYMMLAEKLYRSQAELRAIDHAGFNPFAEPFNFGPRIDSNRSVLELVQSSLHHWPGSWRDVSDPCHPHEARQLHLQIDKAYHQLGWHPRWNFDDTVARSVGWYRAVNDGACPLICCLRDINAYTCDSRCD